MITLCGIVAGLAFAVMLVGFRHNIAILSGLGGAMFMAALVIGGALETAASRK